MRLRWSVTRALVPRLGESVKRLDAVFAAVGACAGGWGSSWEGCFQSRCWSEDCIAQEGCMCVCVFKGLGEVLESSTAEIQIKITSQAGIWGGDPV